MNTTIATSRLLLRPLNAADFADYLEYAQDPQVMHYIREIESVDALRQHFLGYSAPWHGQELVWMGCGVELTAAGKIIGDLGFRYRDKYSEIIEIGFKFNRHYHGQGYAFEAVQALIELIVADWPVHKLIGCADPENIASTRLMEKLGMVKEAHFKSHYRIGDHWTDEAVYGLVVRGG